MIWDCNICYIINFWLIYIKFFYYWFSNIQCDCCTKFDCLTMTSKPTINHIKDQIILSERKKKGGGHLWFTQRSTMCTIFLNSLFESKDFLSNELKWKSLELGRVFTWNEAQMFLQTIFCHKYPWLSQIWTECCKINNKMNIYPVVLHTYI